MSNKIVDVALTKAGMKAPGVEHVQNWLARFGYLEGGSYEADAVDDETSTALRKYQAFYHLPVTGDFDDATRNQMSMSRCGLPDFDSGIAFSTLCSWNRWSLTYAFDIGTADTADEFQAVRNAFRTWASIVPLTFTEVQSTQAPDILIGWRPANDPDHSMVGGVLAHADFPLGCSVITNSLPKPVHFDDTEHQWAIGSVTNAFDVETVALHEIGHIIGLAHSSVQGSVMFASVSSNFTKRVLTQDDISGAQALYPSQSNWRWCNKCQGLFFGGNPNPKCPAGGEHDKTGSGNYSLLHNSSAAAGQQSNWRWCNKCQGLFFGGNPNPKCPAGGDHVKIGSGNYSLIHRA
ncbi:MAG: matrilysin family metalloendoprotease [Chthonomonas sp.]|nr:matrilysin family metalloendoprotease [Chthonomonas sp.]